jgi:uncharacterized membrane protein YccC
MNDPSQQAGEQAGARDGGRLPVVPPRGSARSLWTALVPSNFDVGAANVIEGLRAAFACAVPIFVGEAFNRPDFSWAAIAAFWLCLADPGGSFRNRFIALSTFAILGALSCATAIWATNLNLWVAIGLGFVWSFAGSFARIYGDAATKVGQLLLVAFLVSIGNFDGRAADPVNAALIFFAGAAWALFLTLIVWRIHPHGPSRRALSLVYAELATLAAALAQVRRATTIQGDPFGTILRDDRRRIREALDNARATIADIRRTRVGPSRRADQQLTLLHRADQIFAALTAIGDLLDAAHGRAASHEASSDDRFDRVPAMLETLSAAILAGDRLAPPLAKKLGDLRRLASELNAAGDEIPAGSAPSVGLYRSLVNTVLLTISDAGDTAADVTPRERLVALALPLPPQRSLRERLITPLVVNLSTASVPLQHALRLAVAASVALLITFWFELGHGYWLTMTTVVILQPYAASTWHVSMKRIVFSVLGGILAAALGLVFHTPWSIVLVVFPISVATMLFRTVDYGLFVLFLTPLFVLISALAEPGNGDLHLSLLRGVNSVLGGMLALAAGMLLWPGRELQRLPVELAKAIGATREFFLRVLDARLDARQSDTVDAARRLPGLASNNAEASVQRLLSEPGNDPVVLEAAMTVVTAVRRLASATTVLSLLFKEPTTPHTIPELEPLNAWIADALRVMADAAMNGAAPPKLPERPVFSPQTAAHPDNPTYAILTEVTARICGQIDIIHAALARLAVQRPGDAAMRTGPLPRPA